MGKITITSDPSTRFLKLNPVRTEVDESERSLQDFLKRYHGEPVEIKAGDGMVDASVVIEDEGSTIYIQTLDGERIKVIEDGQNTVHDGFYVVFPRRGTSVSFKK